MKRSLIVLLILLVNLATVCAQATNATRSFTVSGIKVIFKPSAKNVINVRVYYRGGVANYDPDKAGVENFALQAAALCGTPKYPGNALRDTSDKYDIFLSGISSLDCGYIQLNCISKYFNQGWDMFADAIMNPAFDAKEVQLLKNKLVAAGKVEQSNSHNHLAQLMLQNTFKGTPYAVNPSGTEETLNAITIDDLKKHYSSILNKNRIFIVVAGNTTTAELSEKILATLSNMPSKEYSKPDYEPPVLNDSKLLIDKQATSISFIQAMANAPAVSSPDYVPFRLGLSALSNNLYYNLDTQGKLALYPFANCVPRLMSVTQILFTTNQPQEAIPAVMKNIRQLQKTGVNDDWLMRIKNSFVLSNFIGEQSVAGVTDMLGMAEITSGWQYADDLPQLVYMATPEQVNKALNTYINGFKWGYLGNSNAMENFTLPQF
ncbi:MAG: pitrilysin family protein [Bacteroidota bacterium]